MKDSYKEVKVYQYPNMKIRVFIPELTSEERARRLKAIHTQAENLLKEVIHND